MMEEWRELRLSGAKNVDRMKNIGMFGVLKERIERRDNRG